MKRLISIIILAVFVSSCGLGKQMTRESQYASLYENMPATILVMPPINNSSNVEAKDLLYTSISRPLVEAGYYVISPLLAMDVLKSESAYDAELFIDKPLTMFRDYFGADAVVFSQIDDWTKRGLGIETKIRYIIKSTITNEILFDRSCDLYLDLQQNSGTGSTFSAFVDLVASVIVTATTDHIVAARKANYYIFKDMPHGKYSPLYLKDKDVVVEDKDVKKRVK
ncbi:Putative lipoprotein NMB1124/NMB1162 precursor [Porphyromonas crevioricanis]|uniref:Lipoprotein NMB1124/NMB1162 n=1 Tax=Porphyromonas crevioricanis TaxID=393921 RepID=A0A2X4STJ3_9PORP|nr:GNA1162 family protein [Porphyromonas crevioricanis]GAD07790.1 hypothetical protein PORCAN_1417 [Porphyromonas crevioricanis JCM 13913]SQH73161.1 Putative lipoprotein NMB1124/NMB1162 precursor [Porphyromonas crevioricanis]